MMKPSKSKVTVSPTRTYYAIVNEKLVEFVLPADYSANNSRGAFKYARRKLGKDGVITECFSKESYLEQPAQVTKEEADDFDGDLAVLMESEEE